MATNSFIIGEPTLVRKGKTPDFYGKYNQSLILAARATHFSAFAEWALEKLCPTLHREDVLQASAILWVIDALSHVPYNPENEYCKELLGWQHVFNVFERPKQWSPWSLSFANASYLDFIGESLESAQWMDESTLMKKLYSQDTINGFEAAAKETGGYRAQVISMDNIQDSEGDHPSFFWYRKNFVNPNGWEFQIRIGMNASWLDKERQGQLVELFQLMDQLRSQNDPRIYLSSSNTSWVILKIRQATNHIVTGQGAMVKNWVLTMLQIAEDIIKNSPFPLTVIGKDNTTIHVSPAYAVVVGYKVEEIIKPTFFKNIYPGEEWEMVMADIALYDSRGYYPSGSPFYVSRWREFTPPGTEQLRHIELQPFPHTIEAPGKLAEDDDGKRWTVRLNSVTIPPKIEY